MPLKASAAEDLAIEVEELRQRLEEAEDTLRAIRSGEVDALVVSGAKGERIYVLQSAEQPYRIFLETMREGAVTLTADGTITYCNAAFGQILKTPLDHVMGASIGKFVAPDDGDRLRRLLERGGAGKASGVIQFAAGGDTAAWVELSLCPAKAGEAGGVCLVATDITERKRAEESLRASEGRFRTTFDSAVSGNLLIGIDRKFVDCNEQACRLLACSREEILGETPASFSPPTQPDGRVSAEAADEFMSAALAGQPQSFTWLVQRKDRALIGIEVSLSSIVVGADTFLLFASISDSTERKKAEELQQYLASIVESSDDAIIGKDPDGTISSWNHGAEKAYGYSEEEALGKPIAMLAPPDRIDEVSEILRRIKLGELVDHYETERIRKDGLRVKVSLTISPMRDAKGRIVGASTIARDITERKRTEEALRRSEAELTEAQRVAHLGNWSMDAKTGEARWSREMYDIFGLDPALPALSSAEQYRIFTPDSWARVAVAVDNAARNGIPYELQLETVRADGANRWVLARGEAVRDERAAIIGLRGVVLDITERKLAEKALRESEETLHTLTDAMPQLVWMRARRLERLLQPTVGGLHRIKSGRELRKGLEHSLPSR